MTVWTVGHSNRAAGELIGLLAEAGIELLVDVRRFPASRRHPQFRRHDLAVALAAASVAYHHEPDLGGRRPPLADSPNRAWEDPGFRGYADHAGTPTFRRALDRLLAAAAGRRTAVMCAEALPWRCHRRLIADALVARGAEVVHLLAAARSEDHRLHPRARVQGDGSLLYPAPADDQPSLFGAPP